MPGSYSHAFSSPSLSPGLITDGVRDSLWVRVRVLPIAISGGVGAIVWLGQACGLVGLDATV